MEGMIYGRIGQAMKKVGAIGKDSKNAQQGFMYRGIDAVYNALNPVMAELGLFICPEILEQKREERTTKNGTALTYSILTIKYTVYAPDGSNVSCVVVGEGMDSGDKASNKAMSVAMKYAMFQLFFIPTEAVDPDAEVHTDVLPHGKKPDEKPAQKTQETPASVTVAKTVPAMPQEPQKPANPVLDYLARERDNLRSARGIGKAENAAIWAKQTEVLKTAGLVPNKALSSYTQNEAETLVAFMYSRFAPTGTELIPIDGQAS